LVGKKVGVRVGSRFSRFWIRLKGGWVSCGVRKSAPAGMAVPSRKTRNPPREVAVGPGDELEPAGAEAEIT
jgi:hypothetical protein